MKLNKLALLLICIYFHTNCSKKIRIYDKDLIDGCKIKLNKEFRTTLCTKYLFIWNESNIFTLENPDKTQYITRIKVNDLSKFFYEEYDEPTGRRKILRFDTGNRKICISEWFDDSASGDSVVSSTLINEFSFNVVSKRFENINLVYRVDYKTVFDFEDTLKTE